MPEATASTAQVTPVPAPSAARPTHQILVLDDESGIRRGCQRVLVAEGHEVYSVESVEQALETLRQHPDIEVALVDLRMPGGPPEAPDMGGMTFLAAARDEAPLLVCNVITAYATIETAMEGSRRGAYDFLAKPFTPDDLLRLVNKSLERSRLLRDHQRLVSERERRLLQLATEQSRLRGIVNSMADAVLVCNADDELVLYNPAALRVMPALAPGREAYPLAEVLQSPELLELVHEAEASHGRLSREIQLPEALGAQWVLANVAPVAEEQGATFLGTVTVLRDITELRRVEQVKAQFVNMVAHELRAPLSAIDGYLSVLYEGLVPSVAKQREMIGRSRQRLRALLDLVSDLLDVARMEAGTVRRQIQPQEPAAIVGDVVELMAPSAAQAQVRLENQVPAGLPRIEADREELVRLFTNLLSNAIKYNRPGGMVKAYAVAEGPYVRFDVADTGVGISPEGLQSLFSEFFREKRRETAQVTGTGLGLSIVKRIVDFYHGRIDVKSRENEGSTFSVWLPQQHDSSTQAGEAATGDAT
ncbi:response regulator [bacterium]|nr:response regulator [bacterium]